MMQLRGNNYNIHRRLVREAEVQSLVSLVRSSGKVVLLLLRRHCIPFLFSVRVDTDVKELCTNEDKDVVYTNTDQHSVAAAVERLVVISVDLEHISIFIFVMSYHDLRSKQ